MKVDPASAKHHAEHQGKTFHFCSARCKEKFDADSARYLSAFSSLRWTSTRVM
ncbi:MAG: YHS domain-containing protein [Luteimonas sp.]